MPQPSAQVTGKVACGTAAKIRTAKASFGAKAVVSVMHTERSGSQLLHQRIVKIRHGYTPLHRRDDKSVHQLVQILEKDFPVPMGDAVAGPLR